VINSICTDIFKTTSTSIPSEWVTITTETVGGDCWGVEHNCDVIDKDGNVHHYEYNSLKT
jgi:hypothetical protein